MYKSKKIIVVIKSKSWFTFVNFFNLTMYWIEIKSKSVEFYKPVQWNSQR